MNLEELSLEEFIDKVSNYRVAFSALSVFSASAPSNFKLENSNKLKFLEELSELRQELSRRISSEDLDSIVSREITKIYYELCSMYRSVSKHLSPVATTLELNTTKLSGYLETTVDSVTFSSNVLSNYQD
jgi:hypothetical protein